MLQCRSGCCCWSWPMLISAFGTAAFLSMKPIVTALRTLSVPLRRNHRIILRPPSSFWSDFRIGPPRSAFVGAVVVPKVSPGSAFRILSTSADETYVDEKENVYRQWTLEDDQLLWKYYSIDERQSVSGLAARLGRGLRGTEARIKALKNVDSAAYGRLFVKGNLLKNDESYGSTADNNNNNKDGDQPVPKKKLIPACEVLRRIQWDPALDPSDYTIRYYDRVDDALVDTQPLAPNKSISGKAEIMADAIPEHRIVAILYKERIVWDREARMDLMFSDPGIVAVQKGYEQWKRDQEEAKRLKEERAARVSMKTQQILGPEAFLELGNLLGSMEKHIESDVVSLKVKAERFVEGSLALFRNARKDASASLDPTLIPTSDEDALDAISEIVALQHNEQIRALLLSEISMTMGVSSGTGGSQSLPEIDENDIEETFVRGSGPGGQKINKTSNKVMLLHKPTQLRVECQDTRSLPQNRKIARKRLQLKLDEFLNGNQSRANLAAQKAKTKKAKAQARARTRQKRRQDERID